MFPAWAEPGNKEENLSSNKRGTRSFGSGASLIALSNDFPHIPSMFTNAKMSNALPLHEKTREKHHQGFNKGEKFRGMRGGEKGTFKKVPFSPPPLLSSLRPARGKLTLEGAGELIRAGRGLAAALDPFEPGNDGFGGKPFSKAGDGFKVAGAAARETDAGHAAVIGDIILERAGTHAHKWSNSHENKSLYNQNVTRKRGTAGPAIPISRTGKPRNRRPPRKTPGQGP